MWDPNSPPPPYNPRCYYFLRGHGTFIYLISEFSQTIFSLSPAKFKVLLQIHTVHYTAKTEWIQREKAALTSPWFQLKCLIWPKLFSGKRPDLHASLQQMNEQNSHNYKTYIWIYLQLLSLQFTKIFIYANHQWKWIIHSVRSSGGLKKKLYWQSLNLSLFPKPAPLFLLSKVYKRLFFLRALLLKGVRLWQILVEIMF